MKYWIFVSTTLLIIACTNDIKDVNSIVPSGRNIQAEVATNVEILYSDTAIVQVHLYQAELCSALTHLSSKPTSSLVKLPDVVKNSTKKGDVSHSITPSGQSDSGEGGATKSDKQSWNVPS